MNARSAMFVIGAVWSLHWVGSNDTSAGEPMPPLATEVAHAYGMAHFQDIEAIKFSFNVARGEKSSKRDWVWEPGVDRVTFHGKDPAGQEMAFSYLRSELDTTNVQMKFVDPRFINDQYWLLFPYHLMWDKTATIEDAGMDSLPIPPGMAEHLIVSYPKDGGYSPGDVYELYVGPDHLVTHWIYRPEGSTEEKLVVTWADNRKVGPLLLSMDHQVPDGSFRVYFTDVAVRMKGSAEWVSG